MARVLVTGASGFVGSQLAAALVRRGDRVRCLVRRTSSLELIEGVDVDLAYGDIGDPEGLRSAVAATDVVYHVAGCTKAIEPGEYYRVNAGGPHNVLAACARSTTPPVVVMVSSLAAAGPSVDGRMRTETDRPLRQVSDYGRSKRLGERVAEQFADRVPITVVRPPIILGEGDRMGLPMFWGIDRFRYHFSPGIARHRFSVIHVADLAKLLILAAERGRRLDGEKGTGPICRNGPRPTFGRCPASHKLDLSPFPDPSAGYYFAACDEHPNYGDLGRMIGRALGHELVMVTYLTTPLVWATAAVVEGAQKVLRRPLYLNLDKAREITAGAWVCSPRRAKEELGFAAAPLMDRLRETVAWYRRKGWL